MDTTTTVSSPVAAAALQSEPEPWDIRDGVKLTRSDGKADLVPVEFPSVPDRIRIYQAYRAACGYREGDEDEPSGDFNEGDAKACCWAALGLCWRGRDVELPSFRDGGRDVVTYGEAVVTNLWFAGYCRAQEQQDAGLALLKAFMAEFFAADRKAQGFSKAKGRR